jgi:streptogramin lyase
MTGTAQSSVPELEVVSHEATAVDPQVRIDLELRNAGNDDNIALTHHNIESKLFDADGNEILREQSGTRGPESSPSSGESRVVEIFLLPEEGTEPASYEITVNCDGVDYDGFAYCEAES